MRPPMPGRWFAMLLVALGCRPATADDWPTLIVHGGQVLSVDAAFSIHQAMAVRGERIAALGSDAEMLALGGPQTDLLDLGGKTLLPGLIDSHVHPSDASLTEFDHPIPEMRTIGDVLAHVRERARVLEPGQWIVLRQVFITRLAEKRYPTRQELDEAAPRHPTAFMTNPDSMLNSLALARSGIDKNFQVTGSGSVEKDPQTGEPTGMLRACTRAIKLEAPERQPSEDERLDRLVELFDDYNAQGITSIADRAADAATIERYARLAEQGRLTVRIAVSRKIDTEGRLESIQETIRAVAKHPLCRHDIRLRIIGIKTFLDGGMLTGSALMREPWGVSRIYDIRDPQYRGVRFIDQPRLTALVETTVAAGLQFTAHAVGDGAVQALLDAYQEVDRRLPIRDTRPCITHANFLSREAIDTAARLGVLLDIQPIWLHLDGQTLLDQFGDDRLRYFQPLRSIFAAGVIAGGGSDHMQKIGAARAINPYDPRLGMWTTVARRPRGGSRALHAEESLDRQQMIRFYTANNAILLRTEQDLGTLEKGKLADFVIFDTDLLRCPTDAVRDAKVSATYFGGKRVH